MGVVREQLHDRVGDVRRVGRRPPLVADRAERLAGGPRTLGGVEDRLGKSRPGDPNSHAVRAIPNAAPGRSSNASAASRSPASFEAPYGLPGSVGSVGCHGRAVGPLPVEDLVGRDDEQVRAALGAGRGQDAGRVRRCAGSPAPDRARSRRHRSRPRHGRRPRAGRGRGARRSRRARRGRTRRGARRSGRPGR